MTTFLVNRALEQRANFVKTGVRDRSDCCVDSGIGFRGQLLAMLSGSMVGLAARATIAAQKAFMVYRRESV